MTKRIWKPIYGYTGRYEVSSTGNVRSVKTGNLLKFDVTRHGYCLVTIYKNKQPFRYSVHRLVAKAFIPNPEKKPQVNHIDGNKLNNKVDNLKWCTAKENIDHAFKSGLRRSMKGSSNFRAKLTSKKAQKIRVEYATKNTTQKELAIKYGVGASTIGRIVRKENWNEL